MKDTIYLSIITPCYNGEKVIKKAIESIIEQKCEEIELIIVNDGSTDNTEEICKEYENNGGIRYYRTENCGAGHARNYGISKAKGKWIAFLDADDLYIEGSMRKVIPALHAYEAQGVEVVYTPRTKGDMQLKNPSVTKAEEVNEISHIPELEFVTCIYKREFLEKKNIRFFEYKEQDVETAFRYRVFSNTPKVVTDNGLPFYFQRNNPNSNTHTWKKDVLHRVKSRIYLELLENNVWKKEDSWLLGIVFREAGKYYLNCIKYGCTNLADMEQVNLTYKRALKLSRTVPNDKRKIKFLVLSYPLWILGNIIGRRMGRR